eukprot:COSAG02_NODE_76_length_41115_cov_60.967817_8_plen_110_part_00
MAGRSFPAYQQGLIDDPKQYLLVGMSSTVVIFWVGGVMEAFQPFANHRLGAKHGILGQIAWITAVRIWSLLPMAGLAGWSMWGVGQWANGIREDEEATIAYWTERGLGP